MSIKLNPGGRVKARIASIATAVALTGTAVLVPAAALADHTTAHLIEQLQAQIVALQAQLNSLIGTAAPVAGAVSCNFTRPLAPGASGDDVKCLQQYLNGAGHQVAASGAGSPGSETLFYGSLTQAAVGKWQDANGVVYGAWKGYFGPVSQAKFSTVAAAAPAPGAPAAPAAPVAIGSGLTVSSPASQPAETLAPQSAARLPFVKLILTASADGDVTVKSVTVERTGLADDAAFDGILLIDEDGTQIGNSKTLSSDHKVTLSDSLMVKAGTSKTVTVAANMASGLSNQAGQTAKLKVTAIDAGSSTVFGSLPIESNAMTINSTLTIGSVTMSIGSLDPGAANTKKVGDKAYIFSGVKASVGSAEKVTFESIRWNQAGSAGSGDLTNVVTIAGSTEYPAVLSADGKYYVSMFGDGLVVDKGANLEFSVRSDIKDGSGRTVDADILKKADIIVKGNTFGYHILSSGGSAGAASAGAFSSNQEPFFNAYAATIDKGSVLLSSSPAVPAGNVPVDVADTVLGAFVIDVRGEPAQVSSFTLNFTFTGSGTSSDVTSVKLYDENGTIVAGPKDPASGVVKWTDTWTAGVGEKVYTVKGKLDTSFATNDTVRVGVDGDNVTVKGEVTGLTITATPSTIVQANTQTVKAASLNISVASTPTAQTVVRGVKAFHFATYIFDATQSGEDVRVTSIQLRDTLDAKGSGDEVNTCQLYDGATVMNTGSDVVDPSDPTGTTNDITFTLTNNLVLPKGTSKRVDLKCNISTGAAANSTHAWGTNAGAANVNSSGANTGTAITETITTGTGQVMTVASTGSFTVTKDSSSPVTGLTLAGKSDVPMTVWNFEAKNEAIKIDDITLTFSSTTASTSDFLKATLWDGATKIGEAVWPGGTAAAQAFATSTLSGDFTIPKDGSKLLTVKVDLSGISVNASTTAGRLLSIDYDGNSSSTGTGASSGVRLGSNTSTSNQGGVLQIMKSKLTLAKISVPTSTIPKTDATLYRFSVAAYAGGPAALYKFTFQVSSSTGGSATTSNFRLFSYSDSAFSVASEQNNPVSLNNVDCVGYSTFSNISNCASTTVPDNYASSSTGTNQGEIVFFFGPVANTASTSEAIIVPAGGTRYFELKGDITKAGSETSGGTIVVSMLGDAARPVQHTDAAINGGTGTLYFGNNAARPLGPQHFMDDGRGFLGTAAAIAMQSANNDFVWSSMSTTTSATKATSTNDWTNGWQVTGLPSTNMDGNTFQQ